MLKVNVKPLTGNFGSELLRCFAEVVQLY